MNERTLQNTNPCDGAGATRPATHIAPTVGRVVWYWPEFGGGDKGMGHDGEQPLRADVCHVNPDGSINLCVNDAAGNGFRRPNVTLHQGDAEGCSLPRPFATWMPYQKQVAAKAEAPEKAADDRPPIYELQRQMQFEQVRELRLKNDFSETQVAIKVQELAREKALAERYQAETELIKRQVEAGTRKP